MNTGDIREYEIRFKPGSKCKLKFDRYYVKKELEEDGQYYFYASVLDDFSDARIIGPPGIKKYTGQVGYARCSDAWVHRVDTYSDTYKPENCGIATAVTFLCMIDRDVLPGEGINLDLELAFKGDEVAIGLAERHCDKVVALINTAKPPEGANSYFSAAILASLDIMILQQRENYDYSILSTADIKKSYNENGYKLVDYSEDKHWYFCKLK